MVKKNKLSLLKVLLKIKLKILNWKMINKSVNKNKSNQKAVRIAGWAVMNSKINLLMII
jgi:hypothetical protein